MKKKKIEKIYCFKCGEFDTSKAVHYTSAVDLVENEDEDSIEQYFYIDVVFEKGPKDEIQKYERFLNYDKDVKHLTFEKEKKPKNINEAISWIADLIEC